MNIYSIYISKNKVNNKSYVGFSYDFQSRKRRHKYDSLNKTSGEYSSKFHRAIRKYGWDNFEWTVIYQSKEKQYTLDIMEKYFIEEYDSFKNGYNSTLGGEGCTGFKHKKEHIENLKTKWLGEKNPMYGKSYVRDDEHRKKMSLLKSGITKTKEHIQKRVNVVSKEWIVTSPSGEQIKIKNLQEFCRNNKLNPSAMGKVSQGKQNNHKGWKCYKLTHNEL